MIIIRRSLSKTKANLTDFINAYQGIEYAISSSDKHIATSTKWPRFVDDICKCMFLDEHFWFSNKFSLKYVPYILSDNTPALVPITFRHPI